MLPEQFYALSNHIDGIAACEIFVIVVHVYVMYVHRCQLFIDA